MCVWSSARGGAACSRGRAQPQPARTSPRGTSATIASRCGRRAANGVGHLGAWLAARHDQSACSWSTPVYFAPFSPNGIGNTLMAIVMAFHMALMQGRRLVVSDWPPRTLDVSYPLSELLLPSACQALFDGDTGRPKVQKCSVIACPLRTTSRFRGAYTQPHWAHMSPLFLDLPKEWAHLDCARPRLPLRLHPRLPLLFTAAQAAAALPQNVSMRQVVPPPLSPPAAWEQQGAAHATRRGTASHK